MKQKETNYYNPIKNKFIEIFESTGLKTHFEITASKGFSNKLKSKIPENRHIIFYFLKSIFPDITGFIEKGYSRYFIIIEVKNEEIKLDHIYQTRKYAELLDAKFAFLVSTKEIGEEIKCISSDEI